MGRLKSVAIFHSAENCQGKGLTDPMPCCEDVSEHLKVDELTKTSFDFNSLPELNQIAVISYLLIDYDLISLEKENPKYYNFTPPFPDQDLQVLNQVFLI